MSADSATPPKTLFFRESGARLLGSKTVVADVRGRGASLAVKHRASPAEPLPFSRSPGWTGSGVPVCLLSLFKLSSSRRDDFRWPLGVTSGRVLSAPPTCALSGRTLSAVSFPCLASRCISPADVRGRRSSRGVLGGHVMASAWGSRGVKRPSFRARGVCESLAVRGVSCSPARSCTRSCSGSVWNNPNCRKLIGLPVRPFSGRRRLMAA